MLNPDRFVVHIVAFAAFALLMVSPIEFVRAAANSDGALSVALQYRSTDLNTSQGVASLYRRIRAAASSVCSPFDGERLEQKMRWKECFDHAVANAVISVHSESLSAYHWQQIRGWKRPWMPTAVAAR